MPPNLAQISIHANAGYSLSPSPIVEAIPRLSFSSRAAPTRGQPPPPITVLPVGPNVKSPRSEGAGRGLVPPLWGQQMTQRMHDQSSNDLCDHTGRLPVTKTHRRTGLPERQEPVWLCSRVPPIPHRSKRNQEIQTRSAQHRD